MDDKTNDERGITMLPMSAIEINNGQLKGLPKNPRLIKNAKYDKLKESITNYPEMLAWRSLLVYPLDKKLRKQIAALAKPYPKSDDNWVKIDRSQFSHAQTTANN